MVLGASTQHSRRSFTQEQMQSCHDHLTICERRSCRRSEHPRPLGAWRPENQTRRDYVYPKRHAEIFDSFHFSTDRSFSSTHTHSERDRCRQGTEDPRTAIHPSAREGAQPPRTSHAPLSNMVKTSPDGRFRYVKVCRACLCCVQACVSLPF